MSFLEYIERLFKRKVNQLNLNLISFQLYALRFTKVDNNSHVFSFTVIWTQVQMRINFLVALVAAMGPMGLCQALSPPSNTLRILFWRKMDSRSKFITSTGPDAWKVRSNRIEHKEYIKKKHKIFNFIIQCIIVTQNYFNCLKNARDC